MSSDDWNNVLEGHPIFSLPKSMTGDDSLELSLNSLRASPQDESAEPSMRQQVMCMKDNDLILATGSEIRMSCLGDGKVSGGSQKFYKVLHTPLIDFEVHQICLNPNRKLLAVAGAFQVAVIVLPRSGFSKLVTARIDCRSLLVGQYYHTPNSSPIAKVDWHPWGEAGSTLLVMTIDGRLREYDVSIDPDEPCKVLDFVSEKRRGSFVALNDEEIEVASFTFGKGKADWGPFTLYALMKSGDIYAFCPYMPEHSSIPSSYIHSLECYVSAKEEFISEQGIDADDTFTTLYDYQRKFVNGLLKQVPAGTVYPSASKVLSLHPPQIYPDKPTRQGPFLLQPSPTELEGSPGGCATDIIYMTLGSAFSEDENAEFALNSERLGAILVSYQDGRVDVYLDLEKIEARWSVKHTRTSDLPMLAVYEVVNLGVISTLSSHSLNASRKGALDLIQGNNPVFYPDPIHDDTIYVYDAFGVYVLNLSPALQNLLKALKEEKEDNFVSSVQKSGNVSVQTILSTYSVEQRSSNPVIAVVVPSDVYLTYSIFILTSTMRVVSFALNLRAESIDETVNSKEVSLMSKLPQLSENEEAPAYASILKEEPYETPAIFNRQSGIRSVPRLSLPKPPGNGKAELLLTAETMRYLGTVVDRLYKECYETQNSFRKMFQRSRLQQQEFFRQQEKTRELRERIKALTGSRREETLNRIKDVQEEQTSLLNRMDRVLQALIAKASPELNEHESKWFEELERMKALVIGAGRYNPSSLKNRIHQLQRDYDRLAPAMKQLVEERKAQQEELEEQSLGSGFPYSDAYERLSTSERTKLEEAMKQIVKLAKKLELSSLTDPPS